ncbi:hypothetical protein LUZ61_018304 [Rhynchospora tenuis]|uniref:RING-type E3 ubiquitin transferase n=1 Tax=Rhynchospora tenuis TaxID=198213 RepID=A0AAD5Z8Z8_9POAL|nr:hypothetical protein LUZ61_018304 [Rhynchospora tenuis]
MEEIEERREENEAPIEKVYVAVGKEVRESKANLIWALQNFDRNKKLVIVHVHKPATTINIMGAQFPVSQLAEQEVKAYQVVEKGKMDKVLKDYTDICSSQKVEVEKIVIEKDDTAQGIIDLIHEHGVTELVMGAAADRRYSRRLKTLRSRKAILVEQKAELWCKILFVCRGNLICTREATEGVISPRAASSSSSSPSTRSNSLVSDLHRLTAQPSMQSSYFPPRSNSINCTYAEDMLLTMASNNSSQWTNGSSHKETMDSYSTEKPGPSNVLEKGPSTVPYDAEDGYQTESSSPHNGSADEVSIEDIDLYDRLRGAITEAEDLKNEAYEATRRRQKAERDLLEASKKAKAAESLHLQELRRRKDVEERLAREKLEMEQDKQQLDNILAQINRAREQRIALELRISESEAMVNDFEKKLTEAYHLLESLRQEQLMNAERKEQDHSSSTDFKFNSREFVYQELIHATNGFDESKKIGEGSHGSIFKGHLDNSIVAIKMLNHDYYQKHEFSQKVENITKARHPNLISLVGACLEAHALIYEYAPHGSLEDYLHKKNHSMTWQVRARVASELCNVLTYLHSTQPNPIAHGNLKPSNILFDSNYSVKLSDLHLGMAFSRSHISRRSTVAYVEPELLATGELIPACDMYSFGVLLLVLLSGRPAFRIKKVVQEALDKETLHEVLDGSAGDWPLEETKELARLALRCCDTKRGSRPVIEEVCKVVEPLMNAAKTSKLRSWSIGSESEFGGSVPSYFMCPILKEIMKDPQIAADGFTYEAEAIKGWLQSGHDTSPMTNLKLPSDELTPNHALRSAIQEWQQRRR